MSDRETSRHRWLTIALRLAVAVAGIGFIVFTLQFEDRVRVPAGWPVDGAPVAAEVDLSVVERTDEALILDAEPLDRSQPTVEIGRSVISDELKTPTLLPGVRTTLAAADHGRLILAGLITVLIYPLIAVRWWILLRARNVGLPFTTAFRLTMVGQFFNYCMPGTTGGDLVKAWYAAKRAPRRADTALTVLVDRVIGLSGLVVLASVVSLADLDEPIVFRVALGVWSMMAVGVIGMAIYFSSRARRLLGLDRLLAVLPGQRWLQMLDEALLAYRHHKVAIAVAILLSVINHTVIVSVTILSGYALGVETSPVQLAVVLPIAFVAAAVPLTYQGLGVMEAIGIGLLL
ncbi:MAG: lysylphosphatidylglycerol synthase transmembrane domain-containing protein, partial [Phycisphaeraceae bacterium]|nr:lysylphosphatidylglycerol synthase transmembrane domain-containing protein [Phycisphaeraceae bacterium]